MEAKTQKRSRSRRLQVRQDGIGRGFFTCEGDCLGGVVDSMEGLFAALGAPRRAAFEIEIQTQPKKGFEKLILSDHNDSWIRFVSETLEDVWVPNERAYGRACDRSVKRFFHGRLPKAIWVRITSMSESEVH